MQIKSALNFSHTHTTTTMTSHDLKFAINASKKFSFMHQRVCRKEDERLLNILQGNSGVFYVTLQRTHSGNSGVKHVMYKLNQSQLIQLLNSNFLYSFNPLGMKLQCSKNENSIEAHSEQENENYIN